MKMMISIESEWTKIEKNWTLFADKRNLSVKKHFAN